MKRFFWMLLIFAFLFSLTALFADEGEKKVAKTEKVAIEKVGKKVSEMPKVQIGEKSVKIKVSQVKKSNSSSEKKVYRKTYVEKKNTVNQKTVKSKSVQAKTTD